LSPIALSSDGSSFGAQIRRLMFTREAGVFVAVLALCVLFAVMSPVFLSSTNILNLLRQISVLGILAIGATFVLIASEVDLSVGSIYGFAGLVAGMMIVDGTPEIAALLIAVALGTGIGAVNGIVTVWGRIPSFITTLGTLYLVRGMTLVISDGMPVSLARDSDAWLVTFMAQGRILGGMSFQVVLLAIVAVLGFILLHRTTFGFHVFAVGGNDRAARIVGVPVGRTKAAAFALAGGLGAFGGVVNFGFLENVQPVTGQGLELDVIAAVIIGGTRLGGGEGSIVGTLLGVLLIGVVRQGLVLLGVTPFWQTTLIGAVVVAAALIGALTTRK
jgi:ribose/xylose/arabinose/galactoside ABC-type transport system permease subunit